MKAHRETPKPEFIPVTLTLESQAEVDGLFALMNHTVLIHASGIPSHAYASLLPFKDGKNTDKLHQKISDVVQ